MAAERLRVRHVQQRVPSGRILETPHIRNGPRLYYATVGTVDEYGANGNFIRRTQHVSDVPTKAVQAKPSPC